MVAMRNLFLKNCNYIRFLKGKSFIGQLHPAIGSEDQRNPIVGLLVPIQIAIDECELWSGQELPRKEFVTYLRNNDIFLGDANDFLKSKEQRSKNIISESVMNTARLHDIANALDVSILRRDGAKLLGRKGYIIALDTGLVVHAANKSKRHYSSLRKQLAFMEPRNTCHDDVAEFSLDRLPTPEEGRAIRKVLGFKKRPQKQVQSQAGEKIGGRSAKMVLVTKTLSL
jgi:hypothetical protein